MLGFNTNFSQQEGTQEPALIAALPYRIHFRLPLPLLPVITVPPPLLMRWIIQVSIISSVYLLNYPGNLLIRKNSMPGGIMDFHITGWFPLLISNTLLFSRYIIKTALR